MSSLLAAADGTQRTTRPSSSAAASEASFNRRLTSNTCSPKSLNITWLLLRYCSIPPPLADVKRAQFSAHHQSIKPAQHTVDPVCKLRDKLFHGVPFFRDTCLETHIIRRLRTPFHFGCGSAALSLCVEIESPRGPSVLGLG